MATRRRSSSQNRVSSALAALPRERADAGRADRQAIDLDPRDRRAELARWPLRQPVPVQLRHDQPARRGLARIDGVGNVSVFGAGQYAMRIWMDPQKLQARGLVPADVINAVNLQSRVDRGRTARASRRCPRQDFQYSINVPSKLDDVSEFENIIIKTDTGGQITRLQGRGARRARRAAVQPDLQAQRASRRRVSPSTSCPTPTRSTWPSASRSA